MLCRKHNVGPLHFKGVGPHFSLQIFFCQRGNCPRKFVPRLRTKLATSLAYFCIALEFAPMYIPEASSLLVNSGAESNGKTG